MFACSFALLISAVLLAVFHSLYVFFAILLLAKTYDTRQGRVKGKQWLLVKKGKWGRKTETENWKMRKPGGVIYCTGNEIMQIHQVKPMFFARLI